MFIIVMLLNVALFMQVSTVLIPDKSLKIMSNPKFMDVSPSGQHIAIANDKEYQIFSYAKSQIIDTFNNTYFDYTTIALHPNEQVLYFGCTSLQDIPRILSENYSWYEISKTSSLGSESQWQSEISSNETDFTKKIIFIKQRVIAFTSSVLYQRKYFSPPYYDLKWYRTEGNLTAGSKTSHSNTEFVIAREDQKGLTLDFYDWHDLDNISLMYQYPVKEDLQHIHEIKLNQKQNTLYIVGNSGTIFVFDIFLAKLEPFAEVQADELFSIDVSDDEQTIAVADKDYVFLLEAIPEGEQDDDDEGVQSNTTGFKVTKSDTRLEAVRISRSGETLYFIDLNGSLSTTHVCDEQPNLKCEDGTNDCLEYEGKKLCLSCKQNYYMEDNTCYKEKAGFPTQILIAFAIVGLIVIVVIFITVVNSKRERNNPLLQEEET